ncbi:MAG: hypothetical protein GXP48_05385 [Acidobacteria bacterium]|nr:hypothetical protein [Acidobacteriota bacterium]
MREAARVRHLGYRTEQAFVAWVKRFVLFHGKHHPRHMGLNPLASFVQFRYPQHWWRPFPLVLSRDSCFLSRKDTPPFSSTRSTTFGDTSIRLLGLVSDRGASGGGA